ncbi:squalene monooxygenase SE2-like [Hevea brasiliensis]|uniref:squalene monooxygenase SE2-like n=1 Tax=Hevea brasiliensis TaxID=3981 RepID=UPI0025EE45FB|nr:squalene monooxygenase SE2-like [Hevea brasiliensis]
MASTINTLVSALSKVFSTSTDLARNELRQACFGYLCFGGAFSNGSSLVLHFFVVAVCGVGLLILPFPSPKSIWTGAKLMKAASIFNFPIMKAKGVRRVFFLVTMPSHHRASP